MTALIQLDQVSKCYQSGEQSFIALDAINLTILRNEFVAITGPSGSGKSTLMNILGCLDSPTSGSYQLAGQPVAQLTEQQQAYQRNHNIGFIFQSFNLLPRTTALDNVIQPLVYRFVKPKQRKAKALEALALVGLADKADNLPSQLSGGQKQRVAIARALVTEPNLLLADEPTGNLDSQTTQEIMSLFERLHQTGNTLVLVTHEADIAARCQRNIRIKDGKVDSDQYAFTSNQESNLTSYNGEVQGA